ncbi:apolipoprotein L3-like [Tiliqua scincoides]|uniref:apolipoprotein L3-like n=1 Tax=Tiliqua scincoides TaxID=71010 RepID=UPI003461BBB6
MEKWQNMTDFEREEHAREIFLKEFPAQRKEIKRCIRSLLEMADAIDETHKKCTIASITANSTSASSGILTVLGMTLAPFTAGGSLILTAAGLGLGAVAAATGLSASIYESASTSKETEKAQELLNECGEKLRMAKCTEETDFSSVLLPSNEAVQGSNTNPAPRVAGTTYKMYNAMKGIKTNVKALKSVQANTGLKGLANRVTEAGAALWGKIRGGKQAEKAFTGTSLAMSKGARLLGAATAGAFVLFDAYNIAQDAKHLTEGAKAETAAKIREKARELEVELQELSNLYLQELWAVPGHGSWPAGDIQSHSLNDLPTETGRSTR